MRDVLFPAPASPPPPPPPKKKKRTNKQNKTKTHTPKTTTRKRNTTTKNNSKQTKKQTKPQGTRTMNDYICFRQVQSSWEIKPQPRCGAHVEIHGYTGCKSTGFVKPDSMKLAKDHLLHDEAGPWNRALQTPVPLWIQGLVRRVLGGAWLFTLSLPLQSPFTWPSLQYPLFKLLQLFACKARDSTRFFFMTRAMHGTWFSGLGLI